MTYTMSSGTLNSTIPYHTIWRDSLHRLRSYCRETTHKSFTPNFSVHPVRKTMLWIEKWLPPFYAVDVLSHHSNFGEDRTTRAGCRCENMLFVCLSVCLSVCHAPVCRRAVRSRGHFEQIVFHGLWVDFDDVFTFFRRDCSFRALESSHFRC